MPNEQSNESRKLNQGQWYWIQKAVIQEYGPKIGLRGIAVYNMLASLANQEQRCFPSQSYIAERLGCSRSTVHRALQKLQETALIRLEKRSRYHSVYQLLKVRYRTPESQMKHEESSDESQVVTNNNNVTRYMNNNVNVENNSFEGIEPKTPTEPKTREELLAEDIAEALSDLKGLPIYLRYAQQYSESVIRKCLSVAKQMPAERIKKSRPALFTYLLKQHVQTSKNNSGN
jgi:biotin operon repressor